MRVSSEISLLILLILILLILPAQANSIVEVCPNCGSYEFVRLSLSECRDGYLTDGEGKVLLPEQGEVIVTKSLEEFYKKFGYNATIEAGGKFRLSNTGEEIYLYCNNTLADTFSYGRNGMIPYCDRDVVYYRSDGWDFRYLNWTSFEPVSDTVSARIVIFPNKFKIKANYSVVLASYILHDDFHDMVDENINLTLLLDANPVGGIPLDEMEVVRKADQVYFLKSQSYKNFHYKFAVVDDKRVIVTTENWKTTNRGFLIEFKSEKIAKRLKELVDNDIKYATSLQSFSDFRGSRSFVVEAGSYSFRGNVTLYILPDSNPIFDMIAESREELLIEVPYMDLTWFGDDYLLDLLKSSCENGAKIRILLDSKHSAERNLKLIEFLNHFRNCDLEAKMIKLKGFDSLHGKMLYADGRCVITSANFNEYGLKLNREIAILIDNKSACNFLRNQFYDDWEDRFEIPDFSLPTSVLSIAIAVLIANRKR
ncbi:hypothetical protein Asulf_00558 [Archaeoglobus sulfaticallidus PM70-1]|uniref:PLD phosphodiesterase domain-containing protein n=1 Tax=Archaeoglobus sulfaticallidus PM70-1 TaxID=387631 RepID=N0BAF7_9EURY|nr:phospholipase D-like domain-containing protein [Archaeoglobus sulfaticallidus]AGK60579.1 hypothetical protein Asulf_00558 [Archaeoglobus sulfaticallidus PM70-1]